MDKLALAWAGGLFEGEGCISFWRSLDRGEKVYLQLVLETTDLDVIKRFQRAVGLGNVTVQRKKEGLKQAWRWRACSFEEIQATIAMLWQFLGERRRATASLALTTWRNCGRRYTSSKRRKRNDA